MKKLFFITAGFLISLLAFGQDPGDLYLPFSNDGYYIENWADTITRANSITVAPDGNLLVTGIVRQSENSSFLMMMDKNGNTMPGNISRGFSMDFTSLPDEAAKAAKIAPDGKTLIAGYYMFHMYHPWIVRLLSNGLLDETFGTDGLFDISSVNMDVQDMAIYQTGDSYSIILCGTSTTGNYPSLVMISENGSLVPGFGTDGVTTLTASRGTFKSISVDSENNVLYASGFVTEEGTIIAKYNLPDGTPDTGFGTGGSLVYEPLVFPGAALAQVLDKSDNTLTLFGSYKHTVGDNDLFAYRLSSLTGEADPSFGHSGWALLRIPDSNEEITAAGLQSDGKYCFAGDYTMDGNTNLFAGRILHNGSADIDFGTNGLLIVPAAGGQFVAGLDLSPRQNIMYITGTNVDAVSSSIFVVAYCTGYETEPEPEPPYTPIVVTNTLDEGDGSLRQAMMDADDNPGPDTIVFNIPITDAGYNPETGVWTIVPLTETPFLENDSTVIDAISQTFNQGNTNATGPEIELCGNDVIDKCFKVNGSGNVIKGFAINRFTMYGISIQDRNSVVTNNYIGTDASGTEAKANRTGIMLSKNAKHCLVKDNLISGNAEFGIVVITTNADSNSIKGNLIGTNIFGESALGNAFGGIKMGSGTSSNIIGGSSVRDCNVISGSQGDGTGSEWMGNGILLDRSDSNIITGNYIGTNKDGTSALSNSSFGIYVYSSESNRIGGPTSADANVISGNNMGGLYFNYTYCSSNTVTGNKIGTDITGNESVPNGGHGIWINYGAVNNKIGPGNYIMNNGGSGILCSSENSMSNEFTMNYISNHAGKGIELENGSNQSIIAPEILEVTDDIVRGIAPVESRVEIFSDNGNEGAVFEGMTTADDEGHFEWSGHVTRPNVTATATDSDGNTSEFSSPVSSIPAEPVKLTVINTLDSGEGSFRKALELAEALPGPDTVFFSIPEEDPGFDADKGIWTIQPMTEYPELINGNTIVDGTTQTAFVGDMNPNGPEILVNGSLVSGSGFILSGDSNEIKGLIISGFQYGAVRIYGNKNRVKGNYLGCDPGGTIPMPNEYGIDVSYGARQTIIGGSLTVDRNVISGNRSYGIIVSMTGTDSTVIKGNYIGTDYTGEDTVCNEFGGIQIVNGSASTIIGGSAEGDRNVISGIRNSVNLYTGNAITIEESDNNVITGNFIGTNRNGSAVLYNGPRGILIARGANNRIGGENTGEANLISGHSWSGILIRYSESRNNRIQGNFIGAGIAYDSLGNGNSGICLDYGASENFIGPSNCIMYNGDHGIFGLFDSTLKNTITGNFIAHHKVAGITNEDGSNHDLTPPSITEVSAGGVSGTACGGCTVEIFSDEGDEGERFETSVTADLSGIFTWSGIVSGPFVTATAIDPEGNTSEFSQPIAASSAVPVSFVETNPVLMQNNPNPFTEYTCIRFILSHKGIISLTIYDLTGRKLTQLASGLRMAGVYEEIWDGTDTAGNRVRAGIYYFVLQTGNQKYVRKMVLTE